MTFNNLLIRIITLNNKILRRSMVKNYDLSIFVEYKVPNNCGLQIYMMNEWRVHSISIWFHNNSCYGSSYLWPLSIKHMVNYQTDWFIFGIGT